MAFLDNSGDIILDAVLTDTGRKRLAAGDGSFRIVKFALGDDEIDYSLYRNSNSTEGRHPSGSAYYDLNIMQTPVLEAFTDNASVLKSKLVSYAQSDLLYLPVIKVNNVLNKTANENSDWSALETPTGGYILSVDATTSNNFSSNLVSLDGLIKTDTTNSPSQKPVSLDQGLDSTLLSVANLPLGDPRRETQYLVELDNRLLRIMPVGGNNTSMVATPSYIDDDNIASYYFSLNSNSGYFGGADATNLPRFQIPEGNTGRGDPNTVLGNISTGTGQYGTRFGFKLKSSLDAENSTNFFTTLGSITSDDYDAGGGSTTYHFIDSTIRITGFTTGYRVDMPVRLIKKAT
jgi:hypothetical protein|tara:strand:+ start:5006 stop:6046 length:1041 start_codon:yes stop_codon:yes gene_type:complete